jgi:hypothetical protein
VGRKTPAPLRGQLDTLIETAEAAARWLRRPAPSLAASARTARLRARGWRAEAVAALKTHHGAHKNDAADLSFALREAVEHAATAVIEAERWKSGPDAELAAAAESLAGAAKALGEAVGQSGERRGETLIQAKRFAAEAERGRLRARADSHESPFFVDAVKRERLAGRLSDAAEAVQQACDALAGALAED